MVAVIAAAKDLQSEPTCTTHVGYDEGGNFLYAETVRTDMGAFNDLSRALAALKEQDHG